MGFRVSIGVKYFNKNLWGGGGGGAGEAKMHIEPFSMQFI